MRDKAKEVVRQRAVGAYKPVLWQSLAVYFQSWAKVVCAFRLRLHKLVKLTGFSKSSAAGWAAGPGGSEEFICDKEAPEGRRHGAVLQAARATQTPTGCCCRGHSPT